MATRKLTEEQKKRVRDEIKGVKKLLATYPRKIANARKIVAMEKKENRELGNPKSANRFVENYLKVRIKQRDDLKKHLSKLNRMLKK